jgi:hypothetical protein
MLTFENNHFFVWTLFNYVLEKRSQDETGKRTRKDRQRKRRQKTLIIGETEMGNVQYIIGCKRV